MQFQYTRTVTTPPYMAGFEGEVKDVDPWIVRQLVAEGYGIALEDYPYIPPSPPASPYPEQEEAAAPAAEPAPGSSADAEPAEGREWPSSAE